MVDALNMRGIPARYASAGDALPSPELSVRLATVPRRKWKTGMDELSVLGIGCARAGSIRNFTPAHEIRRMLSMALDRGVNVIDTANIYGQGDSERIIGQAIKGRRHDAFIVTKIGFNFSGRGRFWPAVKPAVRLAARYSGFVDSRLGRARDALISQDFSPERLDQDLDGSLRRLKVDTIDGVLLHDPPTGILDEGPVADFLRTAKQQGRVKHFGVSVGSVAAAVKALEITGLELLQVDIETARALATHPAANLLREREVALFVRQVLRPPSLGPDEASFTVQSALPRAMVISNVTSAIIGLSSREHLSQAIDAVL